jgi:hypothetical protein
MRTFMRTPLYFVLVLDGQCVERQKTRFSAWFRTFLDS